MATSSRARSMLTGMPRSSRIAAPPNPFVSPAPPPPVEPPQQAYDPKAMAQRVLEMAVRKSPVDMSYDANNDGRITSSDALQVAKGWRPGGGMTGAPQNTPLAGTSPIPQPVYSNPEGPIRKAPIEPPQAGTTNPFSSMALTMGPTFRPQNRLSPAVLPSLGIEGLRALLSGQPLPGPGQPPPGLGQFPQGLGQPPQGLGQPPQGLGQPLQGFGPQDPMLLDMMYRGPSLTPDQRMAQQQLRMDKERQMAASQAQALMNRGQQPFPMNNQPMPMGPQDSIGPGGLVGMFEMSQQQQRMQQPLGPQNPFDSGGLAGMLGVPQQRMQPSALGMTPPGASQFPLGGGGNAFAGPMSQQPFQGSQQNTGNAFAGPMTQQPTQTPPQSAFGFGGPTQQAQGSNNQQSSRPGLF